MLLFPFKMGVVPSSLLHEMEALDNSTHCRPFLLMVPSPIPPPPYKRRREPHNPPPHPFLVFFRFLLRKSSLASELQLLPPPLLTAPTAFVAPSAGVTTREVPSSSPIIHGELLCIIATARLNSSEFLPSQVHRELNTSHSLRSLHPVHAFFVRK
jgi:hypothetical protein